MSISALEQPGSPVTLLAGARSAPSRRRPTAPASRPRSSIRRWIVQEGNYGCPQHDSGDSLPYRNTSARMNRTMSAITTQPQPEEELPPPPSL